MECLLGLDYVNPNQKIPNPLEARHCGVRALRRGVDFDTLQKGLLELNEEFEIELPQIELVEMNRFDPLKNRPLPQKIKFPKIYDYGRAFRLCEGFMEWNPQKAKSIRNFKIAMIKLPSLQLNGANRT